MTRNAACLIILTFLAACQSGPSKEKMTASIQELEKEIGASGQPPPDKLDSLQAELNAFVEAFPKDSLSVNYLSKAGEIARIQRQYEEAISIFDKIEKNYPNTKAAAAAMFMKAFTLDNDLKKLEEAKAAYEAFIQKYPNDDFTDDAQYLLKNLGKSPEELVKEFEAKNQNAQ